MVALIRGLVKLLLRMVSRLVLKVLTLAAFQIGAVVSARMENRSAPP